MRLLSEAVLFTRAYGLRKVARRFVATYVSGERRAYMIRSDYVSTAATSLPDAGLTFRFAREEDIAPFARDSGFPEPLLRAWLKRKDFLYLALLGGRVVALRCDATRVVTPWVRSVVRLRPDQVFMVDMFTHPEFRRMGLTRHIRVALAREMLQRGYRGGWGLQQILNRQALAAFDRTPDMIERVAVLTRTSAMGLSRFRLAMCRPLSAARIAHLLDAVGELMPAAKRVAVLFNPGTAVAHAAAVDDARRAAVNRQMALQLVGVADAADQVAAFREGFDALHVDRPNALIVVDDAMYRRHRRVIVDLVRQARLLAVFEARDYVAAGGLLSVSTAASAPPPVPPELQGTALELEPSVGPPGLALNLAAARMLGVAVPAALRERAEPVETEGGGP